MALPDLDCACATIRRTARLVTQLYSHEMTGLEPTQFGLLSALERMPGCPQTTLGQILGLDKTTLSRNLRLLESKRWIEPAGRKNEANPGDKRTKGFELTAAGRSKLKSGRKAWDLAQSRLRGALEPADWGNLFRLSNLVAAAAQDLDASKAP